MSIRCAALRQAEISTCFLIWAL